MGRGLDQKPASIIVSKLVESQEKARREARKKNMRIGSLWCIGGIIVTLLSFALSDDIGGFVIVTWGAIIFGAIQFFSGLSQQFGK